jgi:hypothetical protein
LHNLQSIASCATCAQTGSQPSAIDNLLPSLMMFSGLVFSPLRCLACRNRVIKGHCWWYAVIWGTLTFLHGCHALECNCPRCLSYLLSCALDIYSFSTPHRLVTLTSTLKQYLHRTSDNIQRCNDDRRFVFLFASPPLSANRLVRQPAWSWATVECRHMDSVDHFVVGGGYKINH